MAEISWDSLSNRKKNNVYKAINNMRSKTSRENNLYVDKDNRASLPSTGTSRKAAAVQPSSAITGNDVKSAILDARSRTGYNPYADQDALRTLAAQSVKREQEERNRQIQNALQTNVQNRFDVLSGRSASAPVTRFADPAMQRDYKQYESNALKNVLDNVVQQNKMREPVDRVREKANDNIVAKLNRYNATHEPEYLENTKPKTLREKAEDIRSGISAGFMQGSGIVPAEEALNMLLERATGQKNTPAYEDSRLVREAQGLTPRAFAAGNVAGNIAKMSVIGEGLNAVPQVAALPRALQTGLTMGASSAVGDIGNVATGRITPSRYAKNILASTAGGAAGGAVSNYVGGNIAKMLTDKKMMTPFMEFVRQTASGTAFGAGDVAARQGIAAVTGDREAMMTPEEVRQQLISSFGFSMINGAIRTMESTAAAKANLQRQVDGAREAYQRLTAGTYTEEEFIQRINTLMQYTDELRGSINNQYLAGNQNAVNNMNDALDVIQESLRERINYVDAARAGAAASNAAGNLGSNILVDNINGNEYGNSPAPIAPITEPPAPQGTSQTQAISSEAVIPSSSPVVTAADATARMNDTQVPNTNERLMNLAEQAQAPTVEEINEELGSPFGVYDASKEQGVYLDPEADPREGFTVDMPAEEPAETPVEAQVQQNREVALEELADSFDKTGKEAYLNMYGKGGPESVLEYHNGFNKLYDAAKNIDPEALEVARQDPAVQKLSYEQRLVAESAGLEDARIAAKEIAYGREGREGLPSTGSIRNVAQRAGEPVSRIQETARRVGEIWPSENVADPEGKNLQTGRRVEARELVSSASENQPAYLLGSDTESTSTAKAMLEAAGYKGTMYVSERGGMHVVDPDGTEHFARGSMDRATGEITVCANNPDASAHQIAGHEIAERAFYEGKISQDDIYDRARQKNAVLPRVLDALALTYFENTYPEDVVSAYYKMQIGEIGEDTPEASAALDKYLEARKEMLCDISGGIDQFTGDEWDSDLKVEIETAIKHVRPIINEALGGALDAKPDMTSAEGASDKLAYSEAIGGNGIEGYSEHQIDNWKTSKQIVVYENDEQARSFIKEALSNPEINKKIYFGRVSKPLAEKIKTKTGVDVEGYNCGISAYEIRKILLNSHGSTDQEGLRGQRQITEDDILNIPRVIAAPDDIHLSDKTYEGRPVIVFEKVINGRNTVVTYVSKKHHDLSVQTMYAGAKKGSLSSSPSGDNSFSHTSETSRGTASSEAIIAKKITIDNKDIKDLSGAGIQLDSDAGVAHYDYSTKVSWKTPQQVDKAVNALMKANGVDEKTARRYVESEMSLTNLILRPENVAAMDFTADDRYTAIKKNSDYPQGTVDFNNNCRKRVPFTTLYDRLQQRNPDRVFTAEDLEIIRQEMIEHGYPVACAFCYVEERRQHIGEIADDFAQLYNNGGLLERFEGKKPYEKLKEALDRAKNDPYKPRVADLTTYEGLRKLAENHKGIADAFQIFNNARGMQSGRLVEGRAEYKREILSYTPAQVKRINDLGGLRIFSYSDFEAINLLDLVQVIQDASAVGLKIQAYTKVPAFARVVRNTGIKLNRSLISKGTGIKYVNGKPELDLDTVEGIDVNDPDFFDSTDDRDIGNIIIGMSDDQIHLAMESSFVDYIIPFHTSLPREILEKKNIAHWKNYKLFQNDKDIATGKNAAKNINIYTDVIDRARDEGHPITNRQEFQEMFFQVAKERNLIPRFAQFLKKDVHGNYLYTPGYEKFLIDFKLFDKNGNIIEQLPVRPEFDDAFNTKLMNDFANGVGYTAISEKLYKDTVKALNEKSKGEKISYSTKLKKQKKITENAITSLPTSDTTGRELSKAQQKFFENSAVRDDEGKLKPVFHGTSRMDRVGTVFRADRATSGPMSFFTDNRTIAENYSTGKQDTSIAYDERYQDYYTQFRVTRRGKDMSVSDLWSRLTQKEKNKILAAAPHITMDDDWENIVYDPDSTRGLGNWDQYLLRKNGGNALKALTESWLEDGNLYGSEEQFLDVLKMVGVDDAEYYDPEATHEGVYEVYLNITRPFDAVNEVTEDFVRGYEEWYAGQDQEKYDRLSANADMWDKNNQTASSFAERMRDDIANSRSNAWTSIPDSMTDYLKSLGYDGIMDQGGKGGGEGHTVYIPFYPNQIKNTTNDNPTSENEDIRYSSKLNLRNLTPEEKERFAQYRKLLAERRRERKEVSEARKKLLRKANEAVRLAKNRPGYASEATQELLKDLDLVAVGIRSDTKDKLTQKYFEILEMREKDPNYAALHSEKDMRKVERLFKKQIKDMSLDEVRDMITELTALTHYQETQNKLLKDSQNRDAAEVGRQWVKDLKAMKPLDVSNGVKQLSAKYLRNNLSPERAARMISGYKKGSAAEELVRNLEDGLTAQLSFEQKADALFRPFLEDKANADFVKNASKQTIQIEDKDGITAMISPAMRVALYMHRQNSDNLNHIASGGIVVPNEKLYEQGKIKDAYNRGRRLKLKPTEIDDIIKDMTPAEKAYADLLHDFFEGMAKDAINETSLTLDGIFKAVVDGYFPISTDANFLAKAMDLVNDPTLEGWGNLKARQEDSVNPILLEDATKVLQRHIKKTGQYAGLAIPLRDFQKVYGYVSGGYESSVQKAIGEVWDEETKNYLTQWITDLNTGGRRAETGILEWMRSAYAGSVLTFNPSVALKQTTSYLMAGSILDTGSLMYGLSHKFTKADREYMDSITPWGWARRQGQSTIELGDLAKRRDFAAKLPNWNQAMDVFTTDQLFLAAENAVKKEYPDLKRGDKEYDAALAEKYNQVLWRTQPQYDAMFRPEYLRKTDIGSRTFGMFKTESMQMSGELIDSYAQWRADSERAKDGKDETKKAKSESAKNFYRTFASWVASNMAFAVLGTALNLALMHKAKNYRNDRGEVDLKTLAEKTALNFLGSSMGGFFYGSTVYDLGQYIYNAVKGQKPTWYDIEAPGLSLINDAINNLGNLIGVFTSGDANREAITKAIAKFTLSASKFTPAGFAENLYNMFNSVYLYTQDIREGVFGSYEAGKNLLGLKDTSPTKEQYANRAVDAAVKGNYEKAAKALERTNKDNLSKALGTKVTDKMLARFIENPEDIANYVSYTQDGVEPSIGDVKDKGFSSFVKLRESIGDPDRGSNWHHIVEQEQGPGEGNLNTFKADQINNVNNIISIPSGAKDVHQDITKYYNSVQDFTGGKTVRQWLASKSFDEQWKFGIDKLREYGDVVPTERGWILVPDEDKIAEKIPLSEGTGESESTASKLKAEMTGEGVQSDDRYVYLINEVKAGNLTGEEVKEWAETTLAKNKDFKAWKDAGYASYDYVKYKADLEAFEKLEDKKRKQAVETYVSKISDKKKRLKVWTIILGRKESTCP